MANMWGRMGAPMIQPTKDELRNWLSEARDNAKHHRRLRRIAEYKLQIATRTLGELVMAGKIPLPAEKLGELVLQMAEEEQLEVETQKLLT
ncbi:MAG: hypothetical protein EKK36_11450 [Bradyrhizobiaceae bacterium]|nr:MAG: hypothetical protein EKK36_11450 [Bradyrhizobiaceae bacterium]